MACGPGKLLSGYFISATYDQTSKVIHASGNPDVGIKLKISGSDVSFDPANPMPLGNADASGAKTIGVDASLVQVSSARPAVGPFSAIATFVVDYK